MKLKTIWSSFFQQNPLMIQKSMRHVDASFDETTEYRLRRDKNNESVKKSRAKNRAKLNECASHVQNLKMENKQLNKQLDGLQNELFTLRNLFQQCFSFNINNLPIKPSEIPTSTLYKIIMNKNATDAVLTQSNETTSRQTTPAIPLSNQASSSNEVSFNETDKLYINQIKNALNVVKSTNQTSSNGMSTSNNNNNNIPIPMGNRYQNGTINQINGFING